MPLFVSTALQFVSGVAQSSCSHTAQSSKKLVESAIHQSTLSTNVENRTVLILEAFHQYIKQEFIEGSAIAPALYSTAIHIVSDTEMTAGGEAR